MSDAVAADLPWSRAAPGWAASVWPERLALLLLLAGVGYNFPLAILNAHLFAVNRTAVIAVEALLLGSGLLLALSCWRAEMTRWLIMIGMFATLSLVLSIFRQSFDPKSLRDMLMFAVFILLGMLVRPGVARRFFVALQMVVVAVMAVEIAVPFEYARVVDTVGYLINSRGFSADLFFGDLDLFGATRPDDRYFFPQSGWIRASSIFLEPLSLGNYVGIAAVVILLFWKDWGWRMRALMIATTLLILVGSDGRFGGVAMIVVVVFAPLLRRLPVMLAALYLPAAVLFARVASQAMHWSPLEDNFSGRLARGMKQLFKLDWLDLLGFSIPTPALADSGIAYLVMGQSLLGVLVFQSFLYVEPRWRRSDQRLVIHANAILFTMSIIVSVSMLSIKTAAPMWFLMGVVIALPQNARRPAGEVPAGR